MIHDNFVKMKWQKCIRLSGRSGFVCFLISYSLPYSGNLHRGQEESVCESIVP